MDALVVGALSAVGAVCALVLWVLLVHPEVVLSLLRGESEDWVAHHPGAVRGLRVALGAILVLIGFLTGLSLTFLSGTQ